MCQSDGEVTHAVTEVPSSSPTLTNGDQLAAVVRDPIQQGHAQNMVAQVSQVIAFAAGEYYNITFSVEGNGTSSTLYDVSVTDDKGFVKDYSKLPFDLSKNTSVEGYVVLLAPNNTDPGTVVTVTVRAEAQDLSDFNYAITSLTVSRTVEDLSPPVCNITLLAKNCSQYNCSKQIWTLEAEITENGTGVAEIYTRYGNGSLTINGSHLNEMGTNVTSVNYVSSCCYPAVEIITVDNSGNIGKCVVQEVTETSSTPAPTSEVSTLKTDRNSTSTKTTIAVQTTNGKEYFSIYLMLTKKKRAA
ncbi:uncharacterized protein LOC122816424 [Protopterus annectens]|uniref:uncharacterized protein LOC122816424 n=1 Tax=Protopterus annectens TaxID=7888 RepID=UPI001CFA1677|nr:uncharacterized protein LOC122816424 [Protopterus annectens]